jgi:serine/threonine protein kinase
MAAPQTTDELLQLIRKSGLIEEERLSAFLAAHQRDGLLASDPKSVVAGLIQDGVITSFQGEQFLLGKWKGFTLGKYRLLERIGVGGMGQVFLCEHTYMRRRVAIKVLPPTKAQDPVSLARFYREARVASALDHPNIVKTYDIDQDANLHFLVMEYVDGTSLLDLVKRFGPLNVLRASHYIRQACQGLQYAHQAGMIHRDIKPGNIMVDRQGTAKLLDMGLARFYRDEKDQLTLKYDDKNVLGTADYVAPEQTRDSRNIDIRADIYGMGATFYYILTGQPPFPEPSVAEKLIAHQTKKPRPIRELRPEVPVGLAKIIDKMMAKDPKERFQTPQEVVDALEVWTQQPIDPPPADEMPKLSPAAMRPSFGTGAPVVPMPQANRSSAEPLGMPSPGLRSFPTLPSNSTESRQGSPDLSRPVAPSPSVVDLVIPRGRLVKPPAAASAETHPMPTAPDPTPHPKLPNLTPPPVMPPSAAVIPSPPQSSAARPPAPPGRVGISLPRLGEASTAAPPSSQAPVSEGVTIPLPPSQVPIIPSPMPPKGPPLIPPTIPASPATGSMSGEKPSAEKPPEPPPGRTSKPTIELPKLRSFQGATVPLINVSGTAPPAGLIPTHPPISKPAPPPDGPPPPLIPGTTIPLDPPRPMAPLASDPTVPAAPAPLTAPQVSPPAPPTMAPPPIVPQPTRLSSTPSGKSTAAPTYKPPTTIPFFDQPIMPPPPSLFARLARWMFLILVSSAIGAGLGVVIWYHFFRIQG